MKKQKVIKIGKRRYLWSYEAMDARLITAIGVILTALAVCYVYAGLYVLILMAKVWGM